VLKGNIESLIEIMARLRDPERGCPWDREQNDATLAEMDALWEEAKRDVPKKEGARGTLEDQKEEAQSNRLVLS